MDRKRFGPRFAAVASERGRLQERIRRRTEFIRRMAGQFKGSSVLEDTDPVTAIGNLIYTEAERSGVLVTGEDRDRQVQALAKEILTKMQTPADGTPPQGAH